MAAADAYLYLRKPEIAREIYRQVLAMDPQHHNATVSLFFALVDLDEFGEALPLSTDLAQRYPAWRRYPDGRVAGPNAAKLEADLLTARGKAFADKLAIAQSELEDMLALAPGNDDIRIVLANVYRWRGWPRRSLAQFQIVQNQRPDDLDAKVGVANAQMELRRYRPVAKSVASLASEYPERTQVQKLVRDWELYQRPELYINWRVGESDGPQIGTDDFRIDSYLYSSPLDYNYRFFVHDHYARANLPEGQPENHRIGVGMEYSYRDYRITTELSGGAADNNDVGIGINGDWRVNDYLTLGAGYESNSNDVPLRAIGADINTERYGVSASYRWHESQQVSLAYNYYAFDDGNHRRAISGSLSRRVVNLPAYKLDAQLWLYASDNSLLGAPYFNPKTDTSVSLTLNNDWRVWRSYERSFHHSLGATIGSYWQEGFGTDGTWSLNYQHHWALSDAFNFSYGIARSRRVFDGAPEYENVFFGDADYRF
jgi:biofilm PGA synthesis protein PgaA